MGFYKERLTSKEFKQGLAVGDIAIFFTHGRKYSLPEGWEKIYRRVRIIGFDYPIIIVREEGSDKDSRYHYSYYTSKESGPQLSLF